jgi:hypothetical protein
LHNAIRTACKEYQTDGTMLDWAITHYTRHLNSYLRLNLP